MHRSRRSFLTHSALISTGLALGNAGIGKATRAVSDEPLFTLSATAAVAAMRRGEITAEAFANSLLARAAALTDLNAFIALRPDQVLDAARAADRWRESGKPLGLLHGLPLPVKDSINTRALPTTAGTAALREFQPTADAPVLQQLFAQGAYLFGKTNLHELSLGYTTNNATFGPTHNPYDTSRSPGGSSGGSAAAVAARIAPLAVAEDTLGSIRVPAALCGLVGLRPTIGRYPQGGVMPITPRFDAVGAVARCVADLILFDRALHSSVERRQPRTLAGVRLAVPSYHWGELDPEVDTVCRAALKRLERAGAVLIPCQVPAILTDAFDIVTGINAFEVVANQTAYLEEFHSGVSFTDFQAQISPDIRRRFETLFKHGTPEAVTESLYRERLTQLTILRKSLPQFFADHRLTAMVFPTTRLAAQKIGVDSDAVIGGNTVPIRLAMARNVAAASCAGTPGLSLPAGTSAAGLPIGLEFDVLSGSDSELLALGLSLEKVLGPIAPPALHA